MFSSGCIAELREITFEDVSIGAIARVLDRLATLPNELRCVRFRISPGDVLSFYGDDHATRKWFKAVDSLLTQGAYRERKTEVRVSRLITSVFLEGRWERAEDVTRALFPQLLSHGALTLESEDLTFTCCR